MTALSQAQSRPSHFSTTSSSDDMPLRNGGGPRLGGCEFQQMGGSSQHLYVLTTQQTLSLRARNNNTLHCFEFYNAFV